MIPMYSRIHTCRSKIGNHHKQGSNFDEASQPMVYTVWKKSAMAFSSTDGFSVFDSTGKLAFRVDNYSRVGSKCLAVAKEGEGTLLLMDGGGKPLITLRPQILSLHNRWNGFEGDGFRMTDQSIPLFSMKRRSFFHRDEVEIFMSNCKSQTLVPYFRINGDFTMRSCKITCRTGETAADISRKRVNGTVALTDDVFCLTVHPGFDSKLIMAFVVIMDRLCSRPLISWKST